MKNYYKLNENVDTEKKRKKMNAIIIANNIVQ